MIDTTTRQRPTWMTGKSTKSHIGRRGKSSIIVPPSLPEPGPGTEFQKLVGELGLQAKSGCTCGALMRRMNDLGIAGCERERKQLLDELRSNYTTFSAADKAWAAYNAVVTGLAFKMNPLEPLPGLLDEAIRRASA